MFSLESHTSCFSRIKLFPEEEETKTRTAKNGRSSAENKTNAARSVPDFRTFFTPYRPIDKQEISLGFEPALSVKGRSITKIENAVKVGQRTKIACMNSTKHLSVVLHGFTHGLKS